MKSFLALVSLALCQLSSGFADNRSDGPLVQVKALVTLTAPGPVPKESVRAAISESVRHVNSQLNGRKVAAYLVCDNLNQPELVSAELNTLLTNAPYSGISIKWDEDLPFPPEQILKDSSNARGFQLMAIIEPLQASFVQIPASIMAHKTPDLREIASGKYEELIRPDAQAFAQSFTNYSRNTFLFQLRPGWHAALFTVEYQLGKFLGNYVSRISPETTSFATGTRVYFHNRVFEDDTYPLLVLSAPSPLARPEVSRVGQFYELGSSWLQSVAHHLVRT